MEQQLFPFLNISYSRCGAVMTDLLRKLSGGGAGTSVTLRRVFRIFYVELAIRARSNFDLSLSLFSD